jgi:hypothetical protein
MISVQVNKRPKIINREGIALEMLTFLLFRILLGIFANQDAEWLRSFLNVLYTSLGSTQLCGMYTRKLVELCETPVMQAL